MGAWIDPAKLMVVCGGLSRPMHDRPLPRAYAARLSPRRRGECHPRRRYANSPHSQRPNKMLGPRQIWPPSTLLVQPLIPRYISRASTTPAWSHFGTFGGRASGRLPTFITVLTFGAEQSASWDSSRMCLPRISACTCSRLRRRRFFIASAPKRLISYPARPNQALQRTTTGVTACAQTIQPVRRTT
jgi:hypothetical protein